MLSFMKNYQSVRFTFIDPSTGARTTDLGAKAAVEKYARAMSYTLFLVDPDDHVAMWEGDGHLIAIQADDGDFVGGGKDYAEIACDLASSNNSFIQYYRPPKESV